MFRRRNALHCFFILIILVKSYLLILRYNFGKGVHEEKISIFFNKDLEGSFQLELIKEIDEL